MCETLSLSPGAFLDTYDVIGKKIKYTNYLFIALMTADTNMNGKGKYISRKISGKF
jgi:hypothetical protein